MIFCDKQRSYRTQLSRHSPETEENLGNLKSFWYITSPANIRKISLRRKQQGSSQMATSYQTIRGHTPEGSNLRSHTAGNPKPHTIFVLPSQRKLTFHANKSYSRITSTNPRQFDDNLQREPHKPDGSPTSVTLLQPTT